jgi:hypothetical protein
MTDSSENRPWYVQFWPWFLILLPAAAVVASIVTLIIATTHAPDVLPGTASATGFER